MYLAVAHCWSTRYRFSLYAYGEMHVTSILAGIYNATTPLMTLLVVLLVLPEERPTRGRLMGLGTGFAGVLVVLGIWQGLGGKELLGNLACLAAASCYGLGYPYIRKYLSGRTESSVVLSTVQLLCGTVELAIVTPLFTAIPTSMSAQVMGSVLALGVLGTGLGYILNYSLIRDAGATVASTVTYVVPLFSTLVGVVILGEPLSWNQPVGGSIVLCGVIISQMPRLKIRH